MLPLLNLCGTRVPSRGARLPAGPPPRTPPAPSPTWGRRHGAPQAAAPWDADPGGPSGSPALCSPHRRGLLTAGQDIWVSLAVPAKEINRPSEPLVPLERPLLGDAAGGGGFAFQSSAAAARTSEQQRRSHGRASRGEPGACVCATRPQLRKRTAMGGKLMKSQDQKNAPSQQKAPGSGMNFLEDRRRGRCFIVNNS